MHPDLDLNGVLQAAYQQELQSQAVKARLLKRARLTGDGRPLFLLPWRKLAQALRERNERNQLELGEAIQ